MTKSITRTMSKFRAKGLSVRKFSFLSTSVFLQKSETAWMSWAAEMITRDKELVSRSSCCHPEGHLWILADKIHREKASLRIEVWWSVFTWLFVIQRAIHTRSLFPLKCQPSSKWALGLQGTYNLMWQLPHTIKKIYWHVQSLLCVKIEI